MASPIRGSFNPNTFTPVKIEEEQPFGFGEDEVDLGNNGSFGNSLPEASHIPIGGGLN
jgi:hypothetical protein